jgi:hypothetical protein
MMARILALAGGKVVATVRAAGGLVVVALLASVHAQPAPESNVSGEAVLATDAGVYVATVGSPFRVVKGTRLLATPADVATVSPHGRYLLVSLQERLSSAARHGLLTRPHYSGGPPAIDPPPLYRRIDFSHPVVLHELGTGTTTKLEDLTIRCATWAPDEHAFAFVSEGGIGVFDVRSGKTQILVPSRRHRYASATAWVDQLTGVSGMSGGSSYVIGRQDCGPWIDSGSVAYRAFTREFPKALEDARRAARTDGGGIVRLDAATIPIGPVTILDASVDGRTLIVAAGGDSEGTAALHVAQLSGAGLSVGAPLAMSLEDCRFTQNAHELACVRRTGVGLASLALVDAHSLAEIDSVNVPALSDWLWIGEGSERRALVVQRERDGNNVTALSVADVGRGTVTAVLDRSAISRVTGETAGLRLIGWIPSAGTR